MNLINHKKDFNVDAEWNFFATSHGKGACDGLAGSFKRQAFRASLQRESDKHITNATSLFEWGKNAFKKINFGFCSQEDHDSHEKMFKLRYDRCVTIKNTRQYHHYRALNNIQDPTKARYAERRRAAYLLRLVELQPPTKEELTKELLASIECARAVIPNFKLEPPVKAAKRQRSAEEAKPSAKRPKTKGVTPAKSFAEVARNRIVIGVLDEGDPEGRIPRAQWKWVQAALTNVALEVLISNPGPPPSCTDAGWYQGQIKMIACDDERSVALYKAAIAKVGEVYPGAKLVAVDKMDIPSLSTEGWKFVKVFDDSVAKSGVETKRATIFCCYHQTAGEKGRGDKLRIYEGEDAEAEDHLTSESDICGREEDPMESLTDVESIKQGESSFESELAARLSNLYTERESF